VVPEGKGVQEAEEEPEVSVLFTLDISSVARALFVVVNGRQTGLEETRRLPTSSGTDPIRVPQAIGGLSLDVGL